MTLSIPSLCDQGNGNVAKETEVKSLGVKGGKDSKDGGVVESYVSANKYAAIISLSSHRHLSLNFSIPSLCYQGDGNVAKETEVKSLGVKGGKDSKDGGVVESYVSANKYADIIYLSSHQASLIEFFNPFSLLSGRGKRREGNQGQVPWCEGWERFQGRWLFGKLRECQQVC